MLSKQIVSDNKKNTFLITIDVEDWFQVENFKPYIPYTTWDTRDLRVERNTHKLLDLFDESGAGSRTNRANSTNSTNKTAPKVHTSFFILGWIAERLPKLIREIHNRGHEVASHGFGHKMCSRQSPAELKADLADSKKLFEDIIGGPAYGYRAPSFSINDDILKIIEDAGYLYDASYNSFDKHGRYGKLAVNGFQKTGIAYQVSDTFYELPVSNLSLKPIAYSLKPMVLPWGGGGYFRLTPYDVFKKGIQRTLKKDGAYSFYMHPWEVDPDQPRVNKAPALLKFRHYVNLKSTAKKISKMLDDFSDCQFVTCREYIETVAMERL